MRPNFHLIGAAESADRHEDCALSRPGLVRSRGLGPRAPSQTIERQADFFEARGRVSDRPLDVLAA